MEKVGYMSTSKLTYPQPGEVWHGALSCKNRILIVNREKYTGRLAVRVVNVDTRKTFVSAGDTRLYTRDTWRSWHREEGCPNA